MRITLHLCLACIQRQSWMLHSMKITQQYWQTIAYAFLSADRDCLLCQAYLEYLQYVGIKPH